MKGYKHLSFSEREQIGRMHKKKYSVSEIARSLSRSRQTIYNELIRGKREQRRSDTWEPYYIYDPNEAQNDYDEKGTHKGAALKIGNDRALSEKLEYYILEEKRSPYDALCRVNAPFCLSTFYSYISKGIFLNLTNKDLPEKSKRKPHHHKKVTRAKRPPAGTSIDFRPPEIAKRVDPFHWEMDCVEGKKDGCKKTLLVLTERVTRAELIFLMPDQTAASVVKVLDRLYKKPCFKEIFKSITVDNGSEFAAALKMEFDRQKRRRTYLYYCHPYCSFERGSNENANRLVRRRFPRGMSFKKLRRKDALFAMRWQNSVYRRLLGGRTSEQAFNALAPVPLETFYIL